MAINKFGSLLTSFLKSRSTKGTGVRTLSVFTLSLGTTLCVIYTNYYNYWEGTIYRTQTVDFNILSNLLPTKISILLSKINLSNDSENSLQKTLDSNYGLFGIIVTDCKVAGRYCPNQKIIYASQSKVDGTQNARQRLIPQNDYARIWTDKVEEIFSSKQLLDDIPFVLLRNPPPLYQEWGFESPRDDKKVYFEEKNGGDIIGRAYLLRADKPSFMGELQRWLRDIPGSLAINSSRIRISSRSLVYNSIAISTIITGLLVLLVTEFAYYLARVAQEKEAKAVKDKLNAEQKLRITAEKSKQAIREKQEAEEVARIAAERSEQAIREKQKAEEVARIAADEREQARRSERDLYDSIEAGTRDLEKRIEKLEIENSDLRSCSIREVAPPPQLPINLNAVIQHRDFFDWIDSEPRVSHSVESWLNSRCELRSLVENSGDGYTYLNALGNLLYDATKQLLDDRPRVTWPSPCALPPSDKNSVSVVEHRRPRGWNDFVNRLCNIDCVRRVTYDVAAYGGDIVKVLDSQAGTLGVRFGSADLCLPLRVETTAFDEEQLELIIDYIRNHVM
jgi:hypothetical protein